MNIVIIGQGAIGLLWYYTLNQQPENNVTLQCSIHVKNLPDKMSFTDIAQKKHQQNIHLANNDDFQQADLVIYCLKAYAIDKANSQYHSITNPQAIIIYAHNGLLDLNKLSEQAHNIQPKIAMLMTHGSLKTNDFEIKHTGEGHCDIGLLHGDISQTHKGKLIKVLNTALPKVTWQNNIKEKQWLKLAINCVINPLTAIHNCENGSIASEQFQQDIETILQELVVIAAKNDLNLSIECLTKDVLKVAENTARNCSSMRSDVLAKRKTEIDHINGFIHQQGIKHHIATPCNTELWQQIKKLETDYSS
ncbi:MAG: 2-dehydropantoate 2-reductase [Thalassotalea sp.]|nr:2-dehydropantoate 2-reductase [Thalassotalea sp.]